ncbi:PREDICTED: radial spoke head protein 6 homolog A [Ceratosolen solmsi marchali]|uniref:Radial spoke head protein 6 homolog A n=1 Tax=Ceratosolen solmsi marchali TaxID=326594 RepID=A0AAJ7DU43_9HYME|nr:PREDICTED: radial spoke head protein 6 homolog A [Ceratosolen solmsi marchali]
MAQTYEIDEAGSVDDVPSIKHEIECAKLYLQTFCPEAGNNLYDHISEILSKILLERPKNAFTLFEEYSKKLRNDKFKALDSNQLCDMYVPPPPYKNARILLKLFKVNLPATKSVHSSEEGIESIHEEKIEIPNMFDLLYFFEQADVGLTRVEIVILNLSIRKIVAEQRLKNIRFWGKILGRTNNYYILEATLTEEELEERLEKLKDKQEYLKVESESMNTKEIEETEDIELKALESVMPTKLSYEEGEAVEGESLQLVFPSVPINTWKSLPEVTEEKLGTGANAKIYYVCNSPGIDNWIELPSVTPQQIVVARQTIYIFTGNLESEIHTFPPFPGNEKNYLRAQIARIGAATHVSPIGYFEFDNGIERDDNEEEEDDDDEEIDENERGQNKPKEKTGIVKNQNYKPLPLEDLIDPSMSNWCHHSPYILKQGRVIWQDPMKINSDDENEKDYECDDEEVEGEETWSDGEEEKSEESELAKEVGPPLLTPLSQDLATKFATPWTARQSSKIQPDTAVALVRCNVWPGAYAAAIGKKFANLYIGWGYKHNAYNYNPPAMPEIQDQYVIDSELVEIQDPSFEEEEAYRIAHLLPTLEADDEEGEESAEVDCIENDDG